MTIFAKVGKGILSILILIMFFFFSDEAQARVVSGEIKAKIIVEQNNQHVVSAIASAHRFALEQNARRVVPASRCGQVQKSVGNGHWSALSFSAAPYLQQKPGKRINAIAKSSYLSHIYPSHNFW